ncbi:hypothetical protein [Allorhizobium ampelinum]|uniref:hypothetical protein n=1 Tax=Allorhizobium ampelinum TaxID=3025782 RepID=UPI000B3F9C56|nr:hypothetical protein [Allorhizobium ampelinum]NTA27449.1 hypothetical protein [Allorhizobium ampelinum]OVE94505.1 hypothetical protein B7W85_13215 [Allorhizobium ampelinum]
MSKNQPPPMRMKVERNALVPASSFDAERLASYRIGSTVSVRFTADRMRPLERKYRAILGKVVKECETPWTNAEAAHQALKLACGYVNVGKTATGKFMQWPRSIADFDDAEMLDYYESVLVLLSKLTKVDIETLRGEISHVSEEDDEDSDAPNVSDSCDAVPIPSQDSQPEDSPPPAGTNNPSKEWLETAARMLWSATNVGKDTEANLDLLSNQRIAVASLLTNDVSEDAKAKAGSIYRTCKSVVMGEVEKHKGMKLVAGLAGVDEKDLERRP